ncbi:small-conductance mechanosensitive channel [Sphingomonas aerophila]|uniref:Small-conductance mechanosensitive channel n=2 Tax=Sphingomonas aerophila TaxID=1344948 RepID=A0A7W9EUD9_9SPHN|nr:small-conductance mechanosensitive channel [Sphingomonas aerophila]
MLGWSTMAAAQATPVATLSRQLGQAEADLTTVDRALDARVDAEERQLLRSRALAAKATADDVTRQLQEQLTLVDARAGQLGAAADAEAADIRNQRTSLARQHSALDSAVKRGRLLGITAAQLVDEIEQSQVEQFGQRLSTRVPSPLSPAFWRAVLVSVPRDTRHIAQFASTGSRQVAAQWRGGVPWQALVGLLLALMFLFPGRSAAQRFGQRWLVEGAPGHRVRRSGYSLWRIITGTLSPLLAGLVFAQGLRWSGLLAPSWSGLLDGLVIAITFSGMIAAIGGALLMRRQPSWRVAPIADPTAERLRPFSLLLAGLAFATIMIDAFNRAVGASGAARIATQAAEAMLHALLIGATLFALGRIRAAQGEGVDGETRRAGLGALALLAWLVVAIAVLSVLVGFVGFGLFLVQLLTWAVVLGSGAYLAMAAVDDLATTLFTRDSAVGRALTGGLGLRGSTVDQFGVLLSAVLRVLIGTAALGMVLSPFGAGNGVGTVFGRLGVLAQGVDVGGVTISPAAIVRGMIVLGLGLALVRGFMGWLERRFLPATDLDGSGRNSVGLIARYVGIALAVIWALASLGIGVERIALLLSALSVGIGFGLQAITQNFVSGLILLAERPVKIGDWVRVGTDEGDIKRISVRSTEIELADHSTLIVPNSELITKTVLNKTLANPLGRIQIEFSTLIGVDVDRVLAIVAECFAAEPAILDQPAPAVFIDGLANGRVLFNCFGHVETPRAAYGARSNVLADLLRRFRAEKVDVGTVPQRIEFGAPEAAPAPAGQG